MLNLKKTAQDFMNRHGEEETAKKLGVKVSAVRVWKGTGRIPLPVLQMILDQTTTEEQVVPEVEKKEESSESPAVSQGDEHPMAGPPGADDPIWFGQRIKNLEDQMRVLDTKMIQKLVAFAKRYTDPDRHVMQQGTVTPLAAQGPVLDVPKQVPPENPMMVPQASEDFEEQGEGGGDPDWNRPYTKYNRKQ